MKSFNELELGYFPYYQTVYVDTYPIGGYHITESLAKQYIEVQTGYDKSRIKIKTYTEEDYRKDLIRLIRLNGNEMILEHLMAIIPVEMMDTVWKYFKSKPERVK